MPISDKTKQLLETKRFRQPTATSGVIQFLQTLPKDTEVTFTQIARALNPKVESVKGKVDSALSKAIVAGIIKDSPSSKKLNRKYIVVNPNAEVVYCMLEGEPSVISTGIGTEVTVPRNFSKKSTQMDLPLESGQVTVTKFTKQDLVDNANVLAKQAALMQQIAKDVS